MTIENARNLMTFFENYYGEKYDGVFRDVMLEYLAGYRAGFYQAISSVVVKRYSRSFGKSPGPAEIEKYYGEIFEVYSTKERNKALPPPKLSEEQRKQNITFLGNLNKMLENKKRRRVG